MEGEALRQGRNRVQEHLIAPLEARGMRRKRSMTEADHAALLDRLRSRLAYMDIRHLQSLAEQVEAMAGGKHLDTWPSEVTICNLARRTQTPPASESRKVRTWLQSAAGRDALAEDWHVEVFYWLKDNPGVPPDFVCTRLRAEAADRRRDHDRLRDKVRRGAATDSDLAPMRQFQRVSNHVRAIVEAAAVEVAQ